MKLKREFVLRELLVLILAAAALVPGFAEGAAEESGPADSELSIITDLAGREIQLSLPVDRVVLASARHLHEFGAVGGADILDRIVGWGSDLNQYDQDTFLVYQETFPRVNEIPVVGHHYSGTFSVEKVMELMPDVVVFPLWLKETEGVMDDISRLEKIGIQSVFLDYYLDPFSHPVPSTLLIGRLLGCEERAGDIVDFYTAQVNLVADRLASFSGEKTRAYIEVGSKGAEIYGNTYSSAQGLGALIARAGGENIVDGIVSGTAPVNPEYLLKADPEVIIISGSYWPAAESSMRLGYHADEKGSKAILEEFIRRPGWDLLSAVKNRKVYSLFHGFSFRIYNFAGIQAVACWLYPDLFSDIDPEANFRLFMDRFSPVDYSGVWILSLDD